MKTVKVAIVHDFLNQMGGAEHVVNVFREVFPEAPIYTSIYNPSAVCKSFKDADIRTSFMQKFPAIKKHARTYLPFYPYAFEMFDFTEYDVVLSSSSSFAKGIITTPQTCHICYCYTPMRFAWNYHVYVDQEPFSRFTKTILPYFIHRLRRWDEITSNRVDHYISISREIKRRISKYYRRDSTIIYPPVDTSKFRVSEKDEGYFLILSRLLPYKRIDIAIEACNALGLPLKIVGNGRDLERLQKLAGPTVEFMGRLPDEEMKRCLRECRALIFPGFEDFGLTPLEAMASGKPVIAYAAGGALDTVQEGKTGLFFHQQTPESLSKALTLFNPDLFNPWDLREHAELFDVSVFKKQIHKFVTEKYMEHKATSVFDADDHLGILARANDGILVKSRDGASELIDGIER